MLKFASYFFGKLFSASDLGFDERVYRLVEKRMKKKGKKGNFALKLHMSKAYDRIEWDFLAGMMTHLGFHMNWIVLIMRMILLALTFFLICAKGFSTLINEAKQNGLMKGATIRRERFAINHLFFADDCILFGDASIEGENVVREIIKEYEEISGQRVNFEKSLIYFRANVVANVKDTITNILGVRLTSNPKKYLGLPMMVGRRKNWAFANFLDWFRRRIAGWSLRYLSMGGKEVFVKSVLQSTPVYVMQCFTLPKILCRKLEGIMNKFWWSSNKSNKGIHWSNWDALCKPKSVGGLVRHISSNWTTVNQLIEEDTNTWNRELILNIVDAEQENRILSIPLTDSRSKDMLVWKYEGSAEYSKAPKDMDHLLWSCEALKKAWASLQIQTAPTNSSSSCKNIFVNTFCIADEQSKHLIAISIWALWYRRNKLINEGIKFSLHDLLGFIRGYSQE
ncbi:hypothetical protein PVK06_024432 [Gossypium arboreum]|uniref:Reverse transcriptase n=1 Tax=Gossypium arboreum TaxID=29729 RepID=A0ABR0PE56_GOSAR|nr:hypothetical protein PVK06_024432 [Gossypium arboreum]